ncbi:unnamed protein product [Paramecium sonneborni]|uniref:H-type lectin domain-containing protein n=1 Tax=Paramecium sonneborni TaxID=65129 RepID=A0A8S1RE39_9CILI|nr:unnamed protein product [Paramecium sonneborni]
MSLFYIIFYLFVVKSEHRYEQGVCSDFNYIYDANLNLFTSLEKFRSKSIFIPFSKKFTKIPDVYLNIIWLDFYLGFPQGYSLTLTDITIDGFTANVVCESTLRFYGIMFNWFAFNDDRVQVINNFNITNPNSQYIHAYQKKYCKIDVAISNFVSYYAEGNQFNEVTELTLTSETVKIGLHTINLKQIGYQILLSTSDLFLVGPTIINTSPIGSSQEVIFPTGWVSKNCYFNLLGFQYVINTPNLRLQVVNTFTPQVTLGIYTWSDSVIQQLQHNYYCFKDGYFSLVNLESMSEVKFYDATNSIETHIEVQEINYSQNQILEEVITVPYNKQYITFIYYWKCIANEKLNIQIFCNEDWCKFRQIQCVTNKINIVRLNPRFLIITTSDQLIKITQTAVSFTATQTLNDQSQFQQILFKVEMIQ